MFSKKQENQNEKLQETLQEGIKNLRGGKGLGAYGGCSRGGKAGSTHGVNFMRWKSDEYIGTLETRQ